MSRVNIFGMALGMGCAMILWYIFYLAIIGDGTVIIQTNQFNELQVEYIIATLLCLFLGTLTITNIWRHYQHGHEIQTI